MFQLFQRTVRNFCPKIVRNEGKIVRKLNVGNLLRAMYLAKEVLFSGPPGNDVPFVT